MQLKHTREGRTGSNTWQNFQHCTPEKDASHQNCLGYSLISRNKYNNIYETGSSKILKKQNPKAYSEKLRYQKLKLK